MLIMAISFGCGLGVVMHPEALNALPKFVAEMFSSGIASGGVAAIVANLALPKRMDNGKSEEPLPADPA